MGFRARLPFFVSCPGGSYALQRRTSQRKPHTKLQFKKNRKHPVSKIFSKISKYPGLAPSLAQGGLGLDRARLGARLDA